MPMVYDIAILIGSVILIFVIIYWGVSHGAAMVSDIMKSTPAFTQDYIVNSLSVACGVKDFSSSLSLKPVLMDIKLNSTHVNVIAEKSFSTPIERGGYLKLGELEAVPFIRCGLDLEEKIIKFNKKNEKIIVVRKREKLDVGAD